MEGRKTLTVQRCGARMPDGPCQELPVNGTGRCRLHGGASTGPKTAEGRKRIADAQVQRWGILQAALTAYKTQEADNAKHS